MPVHSGCKLTKWMSAAVSRTANCVSGAKPASATLVSSGRMAWRSSSTRLPRTPKQKCTSACRSFLANSRMLA